MSFLVTLEGRDDIQRDLNKYEKSSSSSSRPGARSCIQVRAIPSTSTGYMVGKKKGALKRKT